MNKLNDLSSRDWLKFQKSWFVHNPPPRRKDVLRHPAKFPETMAQEFIEFFTHRGGVVLDPMAGTGSALVAALRAGRHSYGIELNPAYAAIARQVVDEERQVMTASVEGLAAEVIQGDAAVFPQIAAAHRLPAVDYILTSPPYWDMLHARGAQTQKSRRGSSELDVFYSDDPSDLGNIPDYDEFLDRLVSVSIPRIRDFRGLPSRSFDGSGNYSLGIKEQIIFPEIDFDKVDAIRGMDITIVTTAKTDEECRALLVAFKLPLRT